VPLYVCCVAEKSGCAETVKDLDWYDDTLGSFIIPRMDMLGALLLPKITATATMSLDIATLVLSVIPILMVAGVVASDGGVAGPDWEVCKRSAVEALTACSQPPVEACSSAGLAGGCMPSAELEELFDHDLFFQEDPVATVSIATPVAA
jgi:hypothetical protein